MLEGKEGAANRIQLKKHFEGFRRNASNQWRYQRINYLRPT